MDTAFSNIISTEKTAHVYPCWCCSSNEDKSVVTLHIIIAQENNTKNNNKNSPKTNNNSKKQYITHFNHSTFLLTRMVLKLSAFSEHATLNFYYI
jgi:hypothetical protein